jgi:catechol 2,3-dioxygenase-like lactoylglutathione lyase family enzyme
VRILGFHHLAIFVRELERVALFYREVLGLSEMARHRREDGTLRSIWLAVPGGGFIALEENPVPSSAAFGRGSPGLALLALRINAADRKRVTEELARRGIPIVKQTEWTVYFDDPEGNHLALSHHPSPQTTAGE